ncbi:unnamed protein product [Didymodactylos carnosus]|uniref:ABC-2 type transporter transmembrane domain-containing protein n=1 Tax=Didymodactylos carnosus TaxID=1234261 RepID=A0A815Z0F5_9BILA|nr:unnamed protein product [Didymodactylos carnosus]CAF1577955.1 unnamed protein product [Didymodactylos carnosus]CAF4197149.1 unnamed protein product [Didymodactylos carnosus]CAF4444246.1 unnamed protein product [Didymodactylos carnosus]
MHVYELAGKPCPVYTNPADHLLDVITPPKNSGEATAEERELDAKILEEQEPVHIDLNLGVNKRLQAVPIPPGQPWLKQVQVLLRRTFKEQYRKRNILIASIVQAIIMAILIGTAFIHIGTGQKSIVRREPVIFFCVINQGIFGALTVINTFPVERALTLRERASGSYKASAYFIAKIIVETLVLIPIPIFFSCIVYFLVGLQPHVGKFFLFMFFMFLSILSATSLALMVSALCRTADLSVAVLPLALEITRLFGGYFLAPANLPKYFAWLDALSSVKYAYVGTSINEQSGLTLTCTAAEKVNGTCITSGEYFIHQYGFNYIPIGGCIGALFAYIIFCRSVAFLGVRFLKS